MKETPNASSAGLQSPTGEPNFKKAEQRYSELLKDLNVRMIRLTKQQVTIVDALDYTEAIKLSWYANWNDDAKAYYVVHSQGTKHVLMHRYIFGLHEPELLLANPKLVVDHINGDPCDNRRSNLQLVTKSKDSLKRKTPCTNTSGYRGVYKRQRSYGVVFDASIRIDGNEVYLGTFPDEELAHAARVAKIRELGDPFQRESALWFALLVIAFVKLCQLAIQTVTSLHSPMHH